MALDHRRAKDVQERITAVTIERFCLIFLGRKVREWTERTKGYIDFHFRVAHFGELADIDRISVLTKRGIE